MRFERREFFFLNQFIFRYTVPRTSPVVAKNHYIENRIIRCPESTGIKTRA
jgi:hypothetical protein